MNRLFRVATAFMLSFGSLLALTPAQAQRSCNNPKNSFDANYCTRKVFVKADDDLNRAYQQLRGKLGPKGKQRLLFSQRRWLSERNAQCQEGSTTYLDCVTDKTVERTHFLQDRLRECQSSGCMVGKLND